MGCVLVGCLQPLPSEPPIEPELTTPVIESVGLDCDFEAARWTLTLQTTSWAGDAASLWTTDDVFVERYDLPSVAFERDGSGETFELILRVIGDWRKQGMGNTSYTCADDVSVIVAIQDLDGVLTDCRTLGPQPERWAAIEGAPPCPLPDEP